MATTISISELNLGDTVSFTLYGNTGEPNVTDGVIIGQVTGQALVNKTAAATTHFNIYPTVPNSNNTPNDPTAYNYLVILRTDGKTVEIGIPWISPLSVTRLLRGVAVVTIEDFDVSRTDELITLLRNNGFTRSTVTVR